MADLNPYRWRMIARIAGWTLRTLASGRLPTLKDFGERKLSAANAAQAAADPDMRAGLWIEAMFWLDIEAAARRKIGGAN